MVDLDQQASHPTHLLDLPGDLLANIYLALGPQASSPPFLEIYKGARDRHALYCVCRSLRLSPFINAHVTRLRIEV